eukprot:CAMPEP_0173392700 /NCGR_PEP_ID=MMETSP1356-20130122/20793_1 /TAXON_ID=77927 ORGANISM="Hemiselmis virescens, Strain PCC157" /NCGR_SAMPLE_ID=MMETSP1356 /ASSEMBLY_ACC=CAM_ASM_000847 /LENGTH=478 /DNA_ID=CAMNT_0014350571 /DNA_START=41 /DNA_END=1477 /DNA_ORIENTATION=+
MPKKGQDERTRPVTEQILVDAARIYDAREDEDTESKDLKTYAALLGREDAFTKHLPKELIDRARNMRPPRDRITCLLIGNHSAGKSSFTNWYVGEKIQNESVAIETAGITIIRRGKGRVTWKGPQTISAFSYLEKLGKMEGVTDFLATEFSTSTEKNFPLVEFIDTPGLTDGTLKYPFDVDAAIMELAEHATMIMVFLDPIGKALVSRCMNVVEKLAVEHSAKMSYYLTKFDTAGDEVDRTNVVSQIVQELQGRVRATHALKLHTMFLPERASEEVKAKNLPNKIGDLCQNISKEIDSRVQDVLDGLSKDCSCLSKIVDAKVARNKKCVTHNTFSVVWKVLISLVSAALLGVLVYWTMLNHAELDPLKLCDSGANRVVMVEQADGSKIQEIKDGSTNSNIYCLGLRAGNGIPCGVGLVSALVWLMYLWITKTKPTEQLSAEEMKKLKEIQAHIHDGIVKKHKALKKRLTEDALDDQLR